MKKSFGKITNFIEDVLDGFTSCLFIIMFVIVFLNIILRYFFNMSWMWSIEISLFLYISIIFIGAASATISKDYMKVDIFIKRFPKNIFRFYELILHIFILIFGIVGLVGSIKIIPKTWNTIPSGVITWYRAAYVYFVMAFAFIVISVDAFFQIIKHFSPIHKMFSYCIF